MYWKRWFGRVAKMVRATSGGSLRNMFGTALSTLWWQTPISAKKKASELGISEEMHVFRQKALAKPGPASEGADLESLLKDRVVHQDHAIRAVLPSLKRLRAGLNEPGRLMGVFLFLGATGTGKT